CLLNPNRNPGKSKSEIEQFLRDYLGVQQILWLRGGIAGDDTDGHVDNMARFVKPGTIVCSLEEDPSDESYETLQENYRRLQAARDGNGSPLEVIPLPMPGRLQTAQRRLPASYTNFYIANGLVLFPTFAHANDARAANILQKLFPKRKVIGMDCRSAVWGLGTLHCLTQQQPAL
ncbi:MAG: agmatine deiminase family protein, partial [Acidobacteria bacterium]|nr:agmatine deiminase family protein [Acidobacteriota bacterium]